MTGSLAWFSERKDCYLCYSSSWVRKCCWCDCGEFSNTIFYLHFSSLWDHQIIYLSYSLSCRLCFQSRFSWKQPLCYYKGKVAYFWSQTPIMRDPLCIMVMACYIVIVVVEIITSSNKRKNLISLRYLEFLIGHE